MTAITGSNPQSSESRRPIPQPHPKELLADSVERLVAVLFFALSFGVVVYCLTLYHTNWMHPEVFLAERKHIVGLTSLHWQDIARFFDCEALSDQCTRSRFLTYLTGYVDSFFRLWLVNYMPPHPSITVTWVLSFASLYFLYRTIRDLTDDRFAALVSTGLYALSAGFLSLLLMLFNPGKALAGFFINFCLYLAGRIAKAPAGRVESITALALLMSLLLAYFSDETTWFLCGAIPLLFPTFFERRHRALLVALTATFPLYLAFLTWTAPLIMRCLWGYNHFHFWSWAFDVGAAHGDEPPLLTRLKGTVLLDEAYNIVASQYAWWRSGTAIAELSLLPLAALIVAAAVFAERARRLLLLRTVLLLGAFLLFQCLLLLRHYVAAGTYYYGALFSNFSLLVGAAAMNCVRGKRVARVSALAVAVYIGFLSCSWCLATNEQWIAIHEGIYGQLFRSQYGLLSPAAPLTEAKVAAYWSAVREGRDVCGLRRSFAPKDVWLFEEMEAWRRRNRPLDAEPLCK
jgi:hypothetical protein